MRPTDYCQHWQFTCSPRFNSRNPIYTCDNCDIIVGRVPDDAFDEYQGLRAIRQAWKVEGTNPRYHREQQARLMREWPAMYIAIQRILNG